MRGRKINQERKEKDQTVAAWYSANRPHDDRSLIYKMAEFAEAIETEQELDELLAVGPQGKKLLEQGRPLTWEHFVVLAAVNSREKRLALAKTASREKLSPKEIRDRERPPQTKSRKAGPKPARPTSPESVLQSVRDCLAVELRRLDRNDLPEDQKAEFQKVQELLLHFQKEVDEVLKANLPDREPSG